MMSEFARMVTAEKPADLKKLKVGKTGALLARYKSGVKAVIKPVKQTLPNGKAMQRGIPVVTHPQREVAFYQLAKLLGYEYLVPETVLTDKALPDTKASAQLFVPAVKLYEIQPRMLDVHASTWKRDFIDTSLKVPKRFWRELLALDIIAGARDRHANNVGFSLRMIDDRPVYRLVAWDNAVSFGRTFAGYHNVFHKFLFRAAVKFDEVWPVLDRLSHAQFYEALDQYLTPEEIDHAWLRLRFFQDFPYRLPWKVCSEGHDSPREFPDYRAYFEPFIEERPLLLSMSA
jgi:hypothetical protein